MLSTPHECSALVDLLPRVYNSESLFKLHLGSDVIVHNRIYECENQSIYVHDMTDQTPPPYQGTCDYLQTQSQTLTSMVVSFKLRFLCFSRFNSGSDRAYITIQGPRNLIFNMTTLLEILSLDQGISTVDEIDQAYRTKTFLALKNVDTNYEPFYAVADAYQILRNPALRTQYFELGDKRFFDKHYGYQFEDAVELLIASFGVDKVPFVQVNALAAIADCFKDHKKMHGELELTEEQLRVVRRPGWDAGRRIKQLLTQEDDGSRLALIPAVTELQRLIDNFEEKGTMQVQDELVNMFQMTFGLDWMNAVGAVFYARGRNQYNHCKRLINLKLRVRCMLEHASFAQVYVVRVERTWRDKKLSFDDQVNMFYLYSMLELLRRVRKALDKTIDLLFESHKQTISKRKERTVPAQRLRDMGEWMFDQETRTTSYYDHMMVSTLTYVTYMIIYVSYDSKKKYLKNYDYKFPGEAPGRSTTLVKILIDARDLLGEEAAQAASNSAAVSGACVAVSCC